MTVPYRRRLQRRILWALCGLSVMCGGVLLAIGFATANGIYLLACTALITLGFLIKVNELDLEYSAPKRRKYKR